MFTLSLFLLLGALVTFPSNVRIERHFIVSSQKHCDSIGRGSCLTLSSFAANAGNYLQFSSNVTELSLYPGNHTLHSKLVIAHVNQLWLNSNTLLNDSSDTNIVCINHTVRFEFTNITYIHISNIKFLGCRGNRAESVMYFTLVNALFDGQQKKNQYLRRALELVNSTLKAEKSSFVSNIDGGAVIVNRSTATFLNCIFEGNHAEFGGAIYGKLSSNISISKSALDHNSAAKYGGAISIGTVTMESNDPRHGMLSIQASNFSHNIAEQYGGAMAICSVSVSIHESNFTNNKASSYGGALFANKSGTVNINGTVFHGNNATNYCGGAMHVINSILKVFNSTFSHNSAIRRYGGALCLQEGTSDLSNCNFSFNKAATFGGAIYTQSLQHEYLTKCIFNTNVVQKPTGGGRSLRIYRVPNFVIKNSTFIDCESLSHCDGNNYNTSNCKESNAGYQVSGVGLIITSSMVVFIDTKFMGSCESIYAYKCSINFTGNNRFVEINNEQSKVPSALFVIQSKVSINEECTFMHNAAVSGGAIHAVESTIDINFNSTLVVANNSASDSGGGVYLYRSDFNCKIGSAIKIIDNIAAIEGGGIHAISSAIKVTYTRHSYF